MTFFAEIAFEGCVYTDRLDGVSDVTAAKSDALSTMTQVIRSGFDGTGRAVSARISDENHQLVSTMSLTVTVDDP